VASRLLRGQQTPSWPADSQSLHWGELGVVRLAFGDVLAGGDVGELAGGGVGGEYGDRSGE